MIIAAGTVALIIIYDGLFLIVLSDNDDNKSSFFQRTIPNIGNLAGACGLPPKTLSLFMIKICEFFLPYLWPDQNFDTLPMTVAAVTKLPET